MTARTLSTGEVVGVSFHENARVYIRGDSSWLVPIEQGDIARAAMREGREVSIICEGEVNTRTVRLVPVVVVKARGRVRHIYANGPIGVYSNGNDGNGWMRLEYPRADGIIIAARAMADDAEVEIVSIDGGPDMVRRVGQ